MPDRLHQLNVTYIPHEDRLLLRINTQLGNEFRIWLTRRFTHMLMDVLEKEIDRRGGMPVMASKPETTQMFKQGAMEQPYEEDKARNFPLGETGFLARNIKAGVSEDGNLILELLPEKAEGVTLNLDQSLLFMFHNLLTQGISRTDWRLPEAGENKMH